MLRTPLGRHDRTVVDPAERSVTWLRLVGAEYNEVDRSQLLDLDVAAVAAQLDWPPID